MEKNKLFSAFTLAETLITISIIGVVAAFTIPGLINYYQDQQFKTSYKKAFSVASQAWHMAYNDGLIENYTYGEVSTNLTNFKIFESYFNVLQDCTDGSNKKCWAADGDVYGSAGAPIGSGNYAFVDNSGMSWVMAVNGGSTMLVDTNGIKKPNQCGKDRWTFVPVDNHNSTSGLAVKLQPFNGWRDFTSSDSWSCPTPTCYYVKWLD